MPVFAVPGSGAYPVQPVHVDDLARICTEAALAGADGVVDAAGPEKMSFAELVALIRRATGARAPIVHVPAPVMTLAARALGLLVRDVVLTPQEVEGLMAGLLVSYERPLGQIHFTDWLNDSASTIGRLYANELQRHFDQAGHGVSGLQLIA
jgi:NADH dehydrogenase